MRDGMEFTLKKHPTLRFLRLAPAIAVWIGSMTAPAGGEFGSFAKGYLEAYYEAHPVRATQLGIHEYDSRLPDLSRRAIRRRVAALRNWLDDLGALERARLGTDDAFDHEILEHAIRGELLELEDVRGWQHNPMVYNRLLASGVASLIDREFSALESRLTELISRLDQYDRIISACKKNMSDVPSIWAELALQNTRGTIEFLVDDVPAALAAQGLADLDRELVTRWERAHRRALRRVRNFADWIERDLEPRADGDFRLGRELFERKLLYEEHVTLTIDELVELNDQAIEHYRAWVSREASRIDPDLPGAEVMARIAAEFPTSEQLIPTARRNVMDARDFVVERGIVTLPSDRLPTVRPTPEYARMGFASMSTPGPFETEATEAYYNITDVDPAWSAEQQAQHLTYFNYPGLLGVSIHEAMPGHYVQLLYQRDLPTDVRKVFVPASLVEGWAHYAEQMMVDEGFGDGDPAVRLGQLRRALQRHARWYAGIALHTGELSIENAAERFAEIAYFAPFPALRETRRATYNPTYLYYALGRMQILDLREDYRNHVESIGQTFSLQEFHDRFLRLGLPISLARRALIPPGSGGGIDTRSAD
jgi:hypothetical protein